MKRLTAMLVICSVFALSACNRDEYKNTAPTLNVASEKTVWVDNATDPFLLTVNDAQTPAPQLQITAKSTNPSVLTDSGVSITGDGNQRSVVLTPTPDAAGETMVIFTVQDAHGAKQSTTLRFFVQREVGTEIFVRTIFGKPHDAMPLMVGGLTLSDTLENESAFDDLLSSP